MPEEKSEQKTEQKKPDVIKVSELLNSIQIALDGYEDIFSDFDFSDYNKRLFSEDFLKEIKRRYYENRSGNIEVRFTLPEKKRDHKVEATIKRRLKHYFTTQLKETGTGIGKLRKRGIVHIGIGFILLSSELFLYNIANLYVQLLGVLIVPAGWYGMYSGLEYFFSSPAELEERKKFYERFSKATYTFISEEELVQQMRAAEVERKHLGS